MKEFVVGDDFLTEELKNKAMAQGYLREIVRCGECKDWIGGGIDEKDNFIPPKCTWLNKPRHADDFCSYGERK